MRKALLYKTGIATGLSIMAALSASGLAEKTGLQELRSSLSKAAAQLSGWAPALESSANAAVTSRASGREGEDRAVVAARVRRSTHGTRFGASDAHSRAQHSARSKASSMGEHEATCAAGARVHGIGAVLAVWSQRFKCAADFGLAT